MAQISASDNALLIGGISLFLYFILFPMAFNALHLDDMFDIQKWFLIVGVVLVAIGVAVKVVRAKLL